jgi:hypothetical protein
MVTLADIISALVDCLEVLDEGGGALEARLRKHEKYRQELVALLEIVKELNTIGQEEGAVPSGEFLSDLRVRLLTELHTTTQRGGDEG